MKEQQQVEFPVLGARWDTAGKIMNCSPNKVRQLAKDGKLKTFKVGADTRVNVDSIREFIAQGGDK